MLLSFIMKHKKHQDEKHTSIIKCFLDFFKNNSLTIALSVLFIGCLTAECFVAQTLQNDPVHLKNKIPVGFWQNVVTDKFIDGLASNWQAAFLQLVVLVIFSGFLVQKGAAHSKLPAKTSRFTHRAEGQKEKHSWLYDNSLVLALLLLFLLAFGCHGWSGWRSYNHSLRAERHVTVSFITYLTSAEFWSSNFQTWQAEFLAIAVFVFFSIFLREKDSAESKPVGAGDKTTGNVNK